MNEIEFMKILAYVKCSTYRVRTLLAIDDDYVTPKDIAMKAGIRPNHISNVLKQLKEKGLVVCINEEVRKGRLYKSTSLGKDIIFHIKTSRS